MGLSKTHQSSLTLKGGSTAFSKPFSPQGTRDVPTALLGAQTASLYGWRTIRGLRQQQSCGFLCGDEPAFTQGFAKGLLARCFFRKPTSASLNLKSLSKTYPSFLTLKGGSTSHLGLLPSGEKRKPPYSVLKPLRYKVGGPSEVFSKINPSFFTIKEGSTSLSKPLPSQKGKDVPTALLGAQTATL